LQGHIGEVYELAYDWFAIFVTQFGIRVCGHHSEAGAGGDAEGGVGTGLGYGVGYVGVRAA
jgi:hypothetical protein